MPMVSNKQSNEVKLNRTTLFVNRYKMICKYFKFHLFAITIILSTTIEKSNYEINTYYSGYCFLFSD